MNKNYLSIGQTADWVKNSTTNKRLIPTDVISAKINRNHSMWSGRFDEHGRCQGEGTAFMENGDVYIGGMKDGKMSGLG